MTDSDRRLLLAVARLALLLGAADAGNRWPRREDMDKALAELRAALDGAEKEPV